MNNQDNLLTVHEVAKRLRVDETTVRRWISNGVLPAIVLPHMNKRRAYRVLESTLHNILTGKTLPLADTPHEV